MSDRPSGKYDIGKPEELFYWGPSRATSKYMSDFMTAEEQFFLSLAADERLPKPPKTIVLFWDEKMVWLNNAKEFEQFVEQLFIAYEKRGEIDADIAHWNRATQKLAHQGTIHSGTLLDAWSYTLFAELALYGAEDVLRKRLERFGASDWQEIWGVFTTLENGTFLARIDKELLHSKDPAGMAAKYPWVQDGYKGISNNALSYFQERLQQLNRATDSIEELPRSTPTNSPKFRLQDNEVRALILTHKIVEFMDDRKAWMMQSRRFITEPLGTVEYGWAFEDGAITTITKTTAEKLWHYYIDFKTSDAVLQGMVASNGTKHTITGEVAIALSPTDAIEADKILVVPATGPSYVPLMRQARALITDHGGRLSHAAIVAREFGLPCIVGTRQATKILKDNDKISLNLVTGEVSLLTK